MKFFARWQMYFIACLFVTFAVANGATQHFGKALMSLVMASFVFAIMHEAK